MATKHYMYVQMILPCFFSTGFNFGNFPPRKEVLGESLVGPPGVGEGDLLNPGPAAGSLGELESFGDPPGGFGPKLGGGGTTAGGTLGDR